MDYTDLLNLLTIIAFGITIIAFIISIYQSYQSFKQTKELKSQTNYLISHSSDLKEIVGGLSTKYIGPYPDYLDNVISLISQASNEVKIICSIPTPYIFGDPNRWLKYEQILVKQAFNNIDITLITLNESDRLKRLELEFCIAKSQWDQWFEERKKTVKNFISRYYQTEDLELLDYQKFISLLIDIQNRKLQEVYKSNSIKVLEYDRLLPIHMWIIDSKEAIFSLQNQSIGRSHVGFKTNDQTLISALSKMIELYQMDKHTRIDTIVVTSDLQKSIRYYKEIIGLQMRPICNPVAIFIYEHISLYVYNDLFFKQQFGVDAKEVSNGMLSIQVSDINVYFQIVTAIEESPQNFGQFLFKAEKRCIIKDFNDFVMEIWIN